MKSLKPHFTLLAICSAVMTGCATQNIESSSPVVSTEPVTINEAPKFIARKPVETSVTKSPKQFRSPAFPQESRTILFEYDSSALNQESQEIITAHVQFLQDNPDMTVTIEGHTDSRGTDAYNQALGQLRAQAIREAMLEANIDPSKIKLVSFGESKPVMEGNSHIAWRFNRRATIVYENNPNTLASN